MSKSPDILFKTARFKLSEEKPHFINPCCFGEDLAAWLRERLIERGYSVDEPDQEDWGWYIEPAKDVANYFVGIGGNSDEDPTSPNAGEWRLIVQKRRSFSDRLLSRGQDDGALAAILLELLKAETDFSDMRVEEVGS